MHNSALLDPISIPFELRFLAACCDHPQNPDAAARIDSLIDHVEDWNVIAAAARRHQVQGFLHDRLKDAPSIPSQLREQWAQEARQRAIFNLRQASATGKLHALLKENAIPNLVVKGLPLAAKLYKSLTIKRSGDIDLLVNESDAWSAVELLAKAGFVAAENGKALTKSQVIAIVRHYKEITLRNDQNMFVDLHWRLIENPKVMPQFAPFANSQSIELQNIGSIRVLNDADEFAYLCAHGALSDWSRLKWLGDFNAFVSTRSDKELMSLYHHAKTLGAERFVIQAMGLRSVIWGRPLLDEFRTEIEAIGSEAFLSYPIQRMASPYRPAGAGASFRRIRQQTRVRALLYNAHTSAMAELSGHLRALPDILALPLPRWLDWLYVPLRPVFWLARKLF